MDSHFEMFFYALFTFALAMRWNVYRFVGIVLALLSLGQLFRRPSWPAGAFYLDSIVLEFFFGMLIARFVLSRRTIPATLGLVFAGLGTFLMWMNAHGSEHQPSI